MSDIFQHNANKSRIAQNIADSYSDAAPIVSAAQPTQTPFEHQQLVKAQIANSFNTENTLSSEELEKSADDFLEKGGKRAVIGERRTFGGREYIKTKDGWKFHGKGGGAKATAHREGALDHHVESGKDKNSDYKITEPLVKFLDAQKFDDDEAADVSYVGDKIDHYAENVGIQFSDEETISLAKQYAKIRKDKAVESSSKMKVVDKTIAQDRKDLQKQLKQLQQKPLHQQDKEKINKIKQDLANLGDKDKQPTSKHIGDMSATEMKAAADKLGIDVKGKSVKQVRKELTDANIDKQIAEFKDKKKDNLENGIDDIKAKLNHYKFKEHNDRYGGKAISFSKHDRVEDSSFDIQEQSDPNAAGKFYVNMITKKEVSSVSLADPSKNYQTTSARRVKHKTIKTIDYVNSLQEVHKLIDKHLSKLDK